MSETTATRFAIRGRVQGVGYRAWFAREAVRRGLKGWVRNRHDGSVEALVFAPPEDLEDLILAARRGPPSAAVAEVRAAGETVPVGEAFDDFAVWPTG
ncbi:acylphosphatase [Ancylobacter sp. TS-1]|uniref:acylphosphatase n=1 Tax=Ancylobacter sp. TS-1 TaxID=1850374 RepID=UPI001265BBC3|nr:acylphosphatase [Ancylobacter sp. TS-1]QFR32164.1 acylphosphatase [Ancylobacter sp. TS-1]